ncbi:MAG: extracellular solute-binding protein [Acidobacteria bacterium]|nr:extracellular solute-binding protein [Acidobacteriota bacterium]
MCHTNLSRRELLKRLGSAASVPLVITSCGGRKPSKLRLYGTGTLDIQKAGWDRLTKDLGAEVEFIDNLNDTGPVIAKMITGTASRDYDLGGLQGGAESELARAGKILPWDLQRIPTWQKIWPLAREVPYTRIEGVQYGLPIALNADSMVYRPDLLSKISGFEQYGESIVDTYAVLFDDRLRGKASMEDAWINSAIFAAIYMKENNVARIDDPSNLTDQELKQVMTFLIDKKKAGHFVKFWNGWEEGVRLVKSGQVVIMTGWEPIVYELRRQNVRAEYAIPREGYEGWSNDLLLHEGVKSKGLYDAAHDVANWLYSGYYGCKLGELRGYVVPNDSIVTFSEASKEFDPAEVKKRNEHVKAKFRTGRGYWQNVRPKEYRLYEEWWSRLRAA